jgi:hypothetical protein
MRPAEIARTLDSEGEAEAERVAIQTGRRATNAAPSSATVLRLYREFKAFPPEEQREYGLFAWPDSMENGALPWEASRAALDLLAYRLSSRYLGRPTVRQVLWYWRLRQASPSVDIGEADSVASWLDMRDHLRTTGSLGQILVYPALELFLAYQPWQGPTQRKAHATAAEMEGIKHPNTYVGLGAPNLSQEELLMLFRLWQGPKLGPETLQDLNEMTANTAARKGERDEECH